MHSPNANSAPEKAGRTPASLKYILALAGVVLHGFAFSFPPLAQHTLPQYLGVLLSSVFMIGGWTLVGMLGNASASPSGGKQHKWDKPLEAAGAAGLASGTGLSLAVLLFDPGAEVSMLLALLCWILGISCSVATLAAYWARFKAFPHWVGILLAGIVGPVVWFLALGLSYFLLGEQFLVYDAMMFL